MKVKNPVVRIASLALGASISFLLSLASPDIQAQTQDPFVFRDDFTGSSLRPEWRLNNEDSERWLFTDNEYLFLILTHDKGGVKNVLSYEGDLPQDFEITLKFQPPQHRYQHLYLQLKMDPKNQFWVNFEGGVGEIDFCKLFRGEKSCYDTYSDALSEAKKLFLKLKKRGIEYTAFYSVGGSSWTEIGKHFLVNLDGKLAFGAFIQGRDYYRTPETPVKFDYIEIREID